MMRNRYIDINAGLIATVDERGQIASLQRYAVTQAPVATGGFIAATIAITVNNEAVPLSSTAQLSSSGMQPGV